jgi:putative flippase GtrA
LKKLIGFLIAGGSATVLNYLVFLFLLGQSVNTLLSSAIGYVSGIAVSFTINKFLVFSDSARPSFLRYAIVYLSALVLQLALLAALIAMSIPAEFANALAIMVVVVLNFFVMKKFVFKDS